MRQARSELKPSLLRDLPAAERPRERLVRLGPQALSDHELLAILLRTGRRGESAVALAQSVLQSAGGVGRLPTLSVAQLVKVNRLGPVQAVTLAASATPYCRSAFGTTCPTFSWPRTVRSTSPTRGSV